MPTKKQREEAELALRAFDWSKVDLMTDAEIVAAAKADPDSALPTDAELAEFDLVIPAASRRKPPKEAAE